MRNMLSVVLSDPLSNSPTEDWEVDLRLAINLVAVASRIGRVDSRRASVAVASRIATRIRCCCVANRARRLATRIRCCCVANRARRLATRIRCCCFANRAHRLALRVRCCCIPRSQERCPVNIIPIGSNSERRLARSIRCVTSQDRGCYSSKRMLNGNNERMIPED